VQYAGDGVFEVATVYAEYAERFECPEDEYPDPVECAKHEEVTDENPHAAIARRYSLRVDDAGTIRMTARSRGMWVEPGSSAHAGAGVYKLRLTDVGEDQSELSLALASTDGPLEMFARDLGASERPTHAPWGPAAIATGPESWLIAHNGDAQVKVRRVTLE
jgi:hypothetical protein